MLDTIKCPTCEKEKPSDQVYDRINPFQSEVNGVEEEIFECDDCDQERRDDI